MNIGQVCFWFVFLAGIPILALAPRFWRWVFRDWELDIERRKAALKEREERLRREGKL